MKRIILILAALFMLVSCSQEAKPATQDQTTETAGTEVTEATETETTDATETETQDEAQAYDPRLADGAGVEKAIQFSETTVVNSSLESIDPNLANIKEVKLFPQDQEYSLNVLSSDPEE